MSFVTISVSKPHEDTWPKSCQCRPKFGFAPRPDILQVLCVPSLCTEPNICAILSKYTADQKFARVSAQYSAGSLRIVPAIGRALHMLLISTGWTLGESALYWPLRIHFSASVPYVYKQNCLQSLAKLLSSHTA